MENNNQHKIDQLFNEESKLNEENTTFPAFERVWSKAEQKLDEKPNKKRIIPIWFPYGIAASLILSLGVLYFYNRSGETLPNSQETVVKNSNQGENHSDEFDIQKVNSTIKKNIENEAIAQKSDSKSNQDIIAYEPPPVVAVAPIILPPVSDKVACSLPPANTEVAYASPSPPPAALSASTSREKVIEGVVVMGYGKVKKSKDVTSSSVSIKSNKVTSKTRVLNGAVAGIAINSGEGKPGSDVIIRGISSLKSRTSPLIVVDGVLYENSTLNAIDPNTIKSISILKDAAATSIYGNRGSEGVILIETKNLTRKERKALKRKLKNPIEIPSTSNTEEVIIESPEKVETTLPDSGKLTAGEVNDFSKWNYWQDVTVPTLDEYKKTWNFFPNKRVSVQLVNANKKPIVGKQIKLMNASNKVIWESVSDVFGNAELWINPTLNVASESGPYFITDEKGKKIATDVKEFSEGKNIINLQGSCLEKRDLDLAFVVDATGSMGDEIQYLQSELLDVLQKVENKLGNSTQVRYGSVFYRDHGDDYITRKFDFSDKAEDLIEFIKKQQAAGGGDTPEAVVEALQASIENLQWSNKNSTKLLFLVMDAPPHLSKTNIDKLYSLIKLASQKGITIIPLAASDTDKQTEYLMRSFALLTNGTYTFLTDDSGIGNDHIEPTIDSYEIEKLNDLLLRLILQRSTLSLCESGVNSGFINKKLEKESNSEKKLNVEIYPNPTHGKITIKSPEEIDEIYLYDSAGKLIMRKEKVMDTNTEIDITSYPQSMYLMRVKSGKTWDTFKIIKL